MCGIAGFIGQSKKPKASYELMTALFDNLEVRGIDASGFWATEVSNKHNNNKGGVIYHKEPIKSSEFIKKEEWASLRKRKLDLIIAHARATSKGSGHASDNTNNHPFVSSDRKIALAHNGTLEEAGFLKEKYEILSDTDSELLLRIYEHGLDKPYYSIEGVPNDIAKKVNGIKDIWSYVSTGAMAVAIGERIDDHTRGLFLFRNEKRPMWLADMRKNLGQVFFFSSPDIWYRSIASDDDLKNLCWGSQKLMELPPFQVWHMSIDKEDTVITDESLFKMGVNVTATNREFQKGEYCEVKDGSAEFPVMSPINDNRQSRLHGQGSIQIQHNDSGGNRNFPVSNVLGYKPENKVCHRSDTTPTKNSRMKSDSWEDNIWDDRHNPRNDHETICTEIASIANRIETETSNLAMEGSISPSDYESLLESLSQTKLDLEGTLRILRHS
jgi:glucosamine 6-phosphate synthetase-like amidotransferase/phosphosugar isomerase protein